MLAKLPIGSHEHFVNWVEMKDPHAEYQWEHDCPAQTYAAEHGLTKSAGLCLPISTLAGEFPRTWGALAARARKAVDGTASNTWK